MLREGTHTMNQEKGEKIVTVAVEIIIFLLVLWLLGSIFALVVKVLTGAVSVVVGLIHGIWQLIKLVVFSCVAIWLGRTFAGAGVGNWFFPKFEDPKKKYQRQSYNTQEHVRITHRALGDDGYYHTITTNRGGGDARDEHGSSIHYHDHRFHK